LSHVNAEVKVIPVLSSTQ